MKTLQLHPTTKCNHHCRFCSYRDEKGLDIHLEEIQGYMTRAYELGYDTLKISGGGEPLLYPHIITLLCDALYFRFKIYLQTNGENLSFTHWNLIKGDTDGDIRISYGDGIQFRIKPNTYLADGFSYVLTSKPDWSNLRTLIAYALHNQKYVRIIQDESCFLSVPPVEIIREKIAAQECSHFWDLVSIWDSAKYLTGRNPCPSESPVITPVGIFPCCRTQWAKYPDIVLGYNKEMLLGKELTNDWYFDGTQCSRCYY